MVTEEDFTIYGVIYSLDLDFISKLKTETFSLKEDSKEFCWSTSHWYGRMC